ncbi:MAG: hypothetical protein ACP5N9_00015 [Candidatus Bilamarchaeum sp.]
MLRKPSRTRRLKSFLTGSGSDIEKPKPIETTKPKELIEVLDERISVLLGIHRMVIPFGYYTRQGLADFLYRLNRKPKRVEFQKGKFGFFMRIEQSVFFLTENSVFRPKSEIERITLFSKIAEEVSPIDFVIINFTEPYGRNNHPIDMQVVFKRLEQEKGSMNLLV